MLVAIGSDHAGYPYKQPIIDQLVRMGHRVSDFGCQSSEPTDYPVPAIQVSEAVRDGEADMGILICGTGIGMAIAANKVKGIRAGSCQTAFAATAMRTHNQANVLCLGSRINTLSEVQTFVRLFMTADPDPSPRHRHRIKLIHTYEERGTWEK